jgi:hypothetical protein
MEVAGVSMNITIEIDGKEYELDEATLRALRDIAERNGFSIGDALATAIVNEDFIEEHAKDGRLLVQKGDKLQELAFDPA